VISPRPRLSVVLAALFAVAGVAAAGIGKAMAKRGVTVPAPRCDVEKSQGDIDAHRLKLKMSLPPGHVKIQVYSTSDSLLAEQEQDFSGRAAGSQLIVNWNPSSAEPVGRIEGHASDATGQASCDFKLSSWFVPIEHEDVNFATGSSDIQATDVPKLEAAYTKLVEIMAKDKAHGSMHAGITLFIAGHTDSVGSSSSNLKLSHDRARSIAAWFRKRGVKQPIAYEGFGETSLKVSTADNVDEVRNRRVDYILSDDPPKFSGAFRPSWKRIP
jgi:outer membrane protein OmpA-like peptidoglycan-associated protein